MSPVLILIGIAAAVWGLVFVLRGSLLAACLLTLLVGSCFGHPFWNATLGPAPVTLDRLMVGLLVLTCLVQRRLGLAEPRPLRMADLVLAAFLSVLVVSTITHNWQDRNYQPVMRLGIYYLMPAAVYWVAQQAPLNERGLRWTCAALAAFGGYLALTAVAEAQGLTSLLFPRYMALSTFEFFGRGRGPFLNPVACGIFQSLGLCAALAAWPCLNRRAQLLLVAALPIFLAGIYFTFTRSVWMGAALAVFVLVGASVPRSWRVVLLGGAVVAGLVLVAARWDSLRAFKRDQNLSAEATAESVQLRPILALVAWHMFLDRPLAGCGYGQYEIEHLYYLADRSTDLPLEKARPYVQHNALLGLLTETGLAGAGLFALLAVLWCRDAWRVWSNQQAPLWARQQGLLFLALVAAWFPNAMFHDTGLISMVNMLMFFMAGVVGGLVPLASQTEAARTAAAPVGWASRRGHPA